MEQERQLLFNILIKLEAPDGDASRECSWKRKNLLVSYTISGTKQAMQTKNQKDLTYRWSCLSYRCCWSCYHGQDRHPFMTRNSFDKRAKTLSGNREAMILRVFLKRIRRIKWIWTYFCVSRACLRVNQSVVSAHAISLIGWSSFQQISSEVPALPTPSYKKWRKSAIR